MEGEGSGGIKKLSEKKPADNQRPHRLVVRTSRCGRDNPGSTPGVVITEKFWYSYTQSQLYYNLRIQISLCFFIPG